MSKLERVYDRSPIWFQNVMTTISGYQRNRRRYGKAYWDYRGFLEDFDTWSLEKQLDYQRLELQKFIKYVNQNSKFYRLLYKDINIDSIKSVNDLVQLPVIEKETIRSNIDDIVTIPRKGAVEGHTGGTTGKSLVVLNRVEDGMKRMAMLDHFKARVGFEHRKMRRATFNGKHIVPPQQKKKIFWRYNAACKQMIYSSFFLTEDNIAAYVDSLNRFKPHAIDGFFTSMLDVANYIERHKVKLQFKPLAIFPTSETLTAPGRELLERVFGCKVYDQYASSEGAPFITECPNQRLHVELASGVFEHFEPGSQEVLVTSFHTHGTPLIRYRIGDAVDFDAEPCSCGLASPTVKEIQGRRLDFLYTPSGAKINGGNVANLFKNMPNALIRAQLVQKQMDQVTAYLEVDKTQYKKEYDDLLFDEFMHKFGKDAKLEIIHVDEIPRESSGKFRMIVNNVCIEKADSL